ncbi:hypothetical protein M2475_000709 [Breznakia sp. PF5-3]|uniref:DUF1538 domain-containing protein n=1 Tax=unclassified Breznakia TaxID=2623764 RepID=UPI00240728E3|nr:MULTISPECIES: DUF1538 domain-containing protein [unclassified Breznakia]MDL2276133.1 DUF1538 domain-containing protein [Breznakia sp. OttesenSCG-928-G09]MDF9824419.1 hypothetical protein [Breznakia sp. PM6-1]MDF9835148.1 hypothetical protein [Breznakia sp. PF5-3]MDF9838327.1 hypothetical protein [Breznakia sp. PFB2-8]MDF9860343.1 hypothetical protein [Breznakia sp. PH5-24]
MNKLLKEKISESLSSVLPIVIIVLLISVLVVPVDTGTMIVFLVGAILLIIGMGLFTLGADISMTPIGEGIGIQFSKSKNIKMIALLAFLIGIIITVAEPDLQVLVKQVPSIPDMVLVLTVAVGVGVFLLMAVLRTFFKWSLSKMLILCYGIVFILAFFVPKEFLAVAFDSGGVTTGPITVPFIMALGIGLTSLRSDKGSQDDSFGLVALSSIGPILAVLILGVCYNPQGVAYTNYISHDVITTQDVAKLFFKELPTYIGEVLIAIVPLFLMFILFQFIAKRFKKGQIGKMVIGYLYTFLGLVLFLVGVNVGFIPVGYLMGSEIGASNIPWILIPLGLIIGYYVVKAEPAVHILNKQVEEVTKGTIPQKAMQLCLSIGVAISLGISMIRILTGISILWFLIPGYVIALLLTFKVPKIFTGIAFDSGGVASGPMTSTFILPFAIGACEGVGGNVLLDAFGVVAMVAMTPLIVIQIMGLIFQYKTAKMEAENMGEDTLLLDDDIIDIEEDLDDERDNDQNET